jgi:2-succinyl-5-enolpyruvyl-6-hydroxy-3-cyclohexene-1-carboxylate synthase
VDATFVVVDNDGGGIFSFLPQAGFPGSFERVFGTPHGRDLADLARFHGLGYPR